MSKKILIIDDDVEILESMVTILKKRSYDTMKATNGEAGLMIVNQNHPDLIVTDVVMPGMGGFDFYKALKTNPETFNIPVIVITVRGHMEDSFRVLGVDDFITKPFTIEQFLEKIDSTLKRNTPDKTNNNDNNRDTLRKKVMILGQNTPVIEKMEENVKRLGFDTIQLDSTNNLTYYLCHHTPDIVFFDVHLSDASPNSLITTILEATQNKPIPIVAYTCCARKNPAQDNIVKTISASSELSHHQSTSYMGEYSDYAFIRILMENLAKN